MLAFDLLIYSVDRENRQNKNGNSKMEPREP